MLFRICSKFNIEKWTILVKNTITFAPKVKESLIGFRAPEYFEKGKIYPIRIACNYNDNL